MAPCFCWAGLYNAALYYITLYYNISCYSVLYCIIISISPVKRPKMPDMRVSKKSGPNSRALITGPAMLAAFRGCKRQFR